MEIAKYIEEAFLGALSGVTGLTYRAYHVDDDTVEDIQYPLCQIVSEPQQEIQQQAALFSIRVGVAVATYFDDDKKRETLSEKAAEVWAALTPDAVDTAMGNVTGADNLGVQGLEYSDTTTTQENNDQRAVRTYTAHLLVVA